MPVRIVNDTPLALAFMGGKVQRSTHHLTVIVKGAFALAPGARAATKERPLLQGDAHWDDDRAASCRYASDFAPWKPRADAVLVGTCHVPGREPRGTARASFAVGGMQKALAVIGDRHWVEQKLGGPVASEPVPFRSMPLRYENAFGGEGFAANPLGKGAMKPQTGSGAAKWSLPNLEHPGRLLRSASDRPEPAGFGPLDRRWPQRTAKVGTYGSAWLAERWPYFPDDFDWGYFNAAPEDQLFTGYLRGDEPLVFEGLHPELARYESRLPGVRPRCFLRRKPGSATEFEEVALELDTVAIDTDEGSLELVWRGLVAVRSRDYVEIEQALLVVEGMDEPARSADHYRDEARWNGAGPSVEELAAAEEAEARGRPAEAPPPVAAAPAVDPAEQAALDQTRADLAEAGVEPAVLDRLKGVTSAAAFSAILVAHLEKAAAAAPGAPSAASTGGGGTALAAIRAELAQSGVDPALLACLEGAKSPFSFLGVLLGGLPKPATPDEELKQKELEDAVAKADAEEKRAAAIPEFEERAARGERLTRDEVVALAAAGKSLAGVNLAELDLSGLDLHGVNLAGANLSGARLARTNLSGADLTGASLRLAVLEGAWLVDAIATGADLEGADLRSGNLTRANLGRAKLTNAHLDEALLEEADLAHASLAHATLCGAVLAGASFDEADLGGAVLRGAKAPRASFRKAILTDAELGDAILDGAILIQCVLDRAKLAGASLREAHLDGAAGTDVSMAGADMTGARASGSKFADGNFTKTRAEGSSWMGAELTGADFGAAALAGANFSGAALAGANFNLARLERANLSRAILVGAKLTRVNLFEGQLGEADLTGADCRASNLFGCELFEAVTTRARFERANVKRTLLAVRGAQ